MFDPSACEPTRLSDSILSNVKCREIINWFNLLSSQKPLLIITGPSGSGKWSTLRLFATERCDHVERIEGMDLNFDEWSIEIQSALQHSSEKLMTLVRQFPLDSGWHPLTQRAEALKKLTQCLDELQHRRAHSHLANGSSSTFPSSGRVVLVHTVHDSNSIKSELGQTFGSLLLSHPLVTHIRIQPPTIASITRRLSAIMREKGMGLNKFQLNQIATECGGDMRQALYRLYWHQFPPAPPSILSLETHKRVRSSSGHWSIPIESTFQHNQQQLVACSGKRSSRQYQKTAIPYAQLETARAASRLLYQSDGALNMLSEGLGGVIPPASILPYLAENLWMFFGDHQISSLASVLQSLSFMDATMGTAFPSLGHTRRRGGMVAATRRNLQWISNRFSPEDSHDWMDHALSLNLLTLCYQEYRTHQPTPQHPARFVSLSPLPRISLKIDNVFEPLWHQFQQQMIQIEVIDREYNTRDERHYSRTRQKRPSQAFQNPYQNFALTQLAISLYLSSSGFPTCLLSTPHSSFPDLTYLLLLLPLFHLEASEYSKQIQFRSHPQQVQGFSYPSTTTTAITAETNSQISNPSWKRQRTPFLPKPIMTVEQQQQHQHDFLMKSMPTNNYYSSLYAGMQRLADVIAQSSVFRWRSFVKLEQYRKLPERFLISKSFQALWDDPIED